MIRSLGTLSHGAHHEFYKDSGKKHKRVHVALEGFQGAVRVDLVFDDGDEVGRSLVDRNTKEKVSPLVFYVKGKPVSLTKPLTGDLSKCGFRINQVSRANRGRKYQLRCTDGNTTALSFPVLVLSKKKKRRHVTYSEVDAMQAEIETLRRENKRLKRQRTVNFEQELMRLRQENELLLCQIDVDDCSLEAYIRECNPALVFSH